MIKIFLILALLLGSLQASCRYVMEDLGLRGGSSFATSINDHGHVVGITKVEGVQRVFLWKKGEGVKICDDIPEGAYACQVNNSGQIVGSFYRWDGWWSPKLMLHGYIWSEADGFYDIGAIEEKHTSAVAINDVGQVILIDNDSQCYLWEKWNYKKMDHLTNVVQDTEIDLACVRMNEREVFYTLKDPLDKRVPGIVVREDLQTGERKTMVNGNRDIPYLSGVSSKIKACGFYFRHGKADGFLIDGDDVRIIPQFMPHAVNDAGVMVGELMDGSGRSAIVYDGTDLIDVNEMMRQEEQPFAYDEIFSLMDVNENGWMIGEVSIWNEKKPIVLIPINSAPECAT